MNKATMPRTNTFTNTFEGEVKIFDDGSWITSARKISKEEALVLFQKEEPKIQITDIKLDHVRWAFAYNEDGQRMSCWVNNASPSRRNALPVWRVNWDHGYC